MTPTQNIVELKLEDVYDSPAQYREIDPDHVERLAESIGSIGQLDPVEVMRDGDIYYVESGHHRVAALRKLEAQTVAAIITNEGDDRRAVKMVAANISRPDNELERARGVQLMLATGVKPEVAAKQAGITADQAHAANRALKRVDAEAAAEHTLDWLLAIDEFADDEATVAKLAAAREGEWRSIWRDEIRKRDTGLSVERAAHLLDTAGLEWTVVQSVPVIEGLAIANPHNADMVGPETMALKAPEGAVQAVIVRTEWSPNVYVHYYADRELSEEQEAGQAAATEAQMRYERRKAMRERRWAFVLEVVERDGVTHAFSDLARKWWRSGGESGNYVRPQSLDKLGLPESTPLYNEMILTIVNGISDEFDATDPDELDVAFIGALQAYGYEPDEIERIGGGDVE